MPYLKGEERASDLFKFRMPIMPICRVEPAVTHRLPHRPVRAQLRHTVRRVGAGRLRPSEVVLCDRVTEHRVSVRFPDSTRLARRFPSLLPGSPSSVRLLSLGTMKPLRLPRASPDTLFVTLRRIPWVGFARSLLAADRPAATRPGCCSTGASVPVFCPKDALGSPMFPGNPMCSCPALRPRPDLGA